MDSASGNRTRPGTFLALRTHLLLHCCCGMDRCQPLFVFRILVGRYTIQKDEICPSDWNDFKQMVVRKTNVNAALLGLTSASRMKRTGPMAAAYNP